MINNTMVNMTRNNVEENIIEDIDIFEENRPIIKLKSSEKLYSKASYANTFYNELSIKFNDYKTDFPKIYEGLNIQGKIVHIDSNDIYIDINHKDYIYCSLKKENLNVIQALKLGDDIMVTIEKINESPSFYIEGNISALFEKAIRTSVYDMIETQIPIDAFVKDWTKAGYILSMEVRDVKFGAFMPNTIAGVNKLSNPSELVNQTIKVILESYSNDNGTFIASRKRYLETLIPIEIEKLVIGQEYYGNVTGTREFGVFVEFNDCLTGMIHETNLDDEWKKMLKSGIIQPGMKIPFKIKEIVKTKLILSQVITPSIWDEIGIGEKYVGIITAVKNFGVLVQLDEETKGLIHESELSKNKSFTPKVGEKVTVKVLSFDRLNRKIYFSPNLKNSEEKVVSEVAEA